MRDDGKDDDEDGVCRRWPQASSVEIDTDVGLPLHQWPWGEAHAR